MVRFVVVLPVLASACVPVFSLRGADQRTCESDFLDYTGGLTHHVLQGNGDGSFDYEPAATHIDRIAGAYDLGSGAFSWEVALGSGFKTAERVTEGEGTIWRDGDLDVAYLSQVDRADGTVDTRRVRSIRLGCQEDTRFDDPESGLTTFVARTYDGTGFDSVRQERYRGVFVEALGRGAPDGGIETTLDYQSGPFDLTYTQLDDGNGTIRREFDDAVGNETLVGFWETGADGTTYSYARTPPGQPLEQWDFQIDPSGAGAGTVVYGTNTCDLTFDAGRCSRSGCTDGSDGPCLPPALMDLR